MGGGKEEFYMNPFKKMLVEIIIDLNSSDPLLFKLHYATRAYLRFVMIEVGRRKNSWIMAKAQSCPVGIVQFP